MVVGWISAAYPPSELILDNDNDNDNDNELSAIGLNKDQLDPL